MNERLVKFNAWVSIIIGGLGTMLITYFLLYLVIRSEFEYLVIAIGVLYCIIPYLFSIPLLCSGINALSYLENEKKFSSFDDCTVIGMIVWGIYLALLLLSYLGNLIGLIIIIILFMIFMCPLVINYRIIKRHHMEIRKLEKQMQEEQMNGNDTINE